MKDLTRLGVVIPLYRQTYLETLLQDLSNQTDKNFALTIVSDGPMEEPSPEVLRLFTHLGANVIKFENPLGREDPSLSWARAVAESNEEWVWLIGDDDRVGPRCVEEFRSTLKNLDPEIKLCRFPVGILSGTQVLRKNRNSSRIRPVLTPKSFLQKRLWGRDLSFASEYVFEYKSFVATGGFVHFPFAWCSDDATWLRLSCPKGIYQLGGPETEVLWRGGDGNTSSKQKTHSEVFALAELMFVDWLVAESPLQADVKDRFVRAGILRWFTEKTLGRSRTVSEVSEKILPLGLNLGFTKVEVMGVLSATLTMSGTYRLIRKIWGWAK